MGATLIFSAVFLSYITSRPVFIAYFDVTDTKTNTLIPRTQKIIKSIEDSPLEITTYVNLLDNYYYYGQPQMRNEDMRRWEPYLRFNQNIKFKYVYYFDTVPDPYLFKTHPGKTLKQIAEEYAKTYNINLEDYKTPAEIKNIIDLEPEHNRYVMKVTYKGKSTFLRIFDDQLVFPTETETMAAIKRLITTLPKIVFLRGELERDIYRSDDRDYKTLTNLKVFRYSLINQGFDVDTVSLQQKDIPQGIAALVIADPKVKFQPAVLSKIEKYIADGGNILIAGEPGKQEILNPLIKSMGVQYLNGTTVQKSKDFPIDMILTNLTPAGVNLSPAMKSFAKLNYPVVMPGATGLQVEANKGFDFKNLLITDVKSTWQKLGKLTVDSADVAFAPKDGDLKKTITTAISLARNINGKQQRIILTGDADFLSTAELARNNIQTSNFVFDTSVFGWFTYGQFPIDDTRPDSRDNSFNLTDTGLIALKWIFMGVLPAFLLIAGTILLIRRKRK